jgi:hypothetical protein
MASSKASDGELVEVVPIMDVYADGVADLEVISSVNVRVTLYTHHQGQKIVVAKIVRPLRGWGITPEQEEFLRQHAADQGGKLQFQDENPPENIVAITRQPRRRDA